jgi:hypothetical protein
MIIAVFGVDTTRLCGPLSNVDFVHFMWDNSRRFNYKKYAMTLFPLSTSSLPRLTCLKYYRAESDGWRDSSNCNDCVESHVATLRPFLPCLPDVCSCSICKRQPPSLLVFSIILFT